MRKILRGKVHNIEREREMYIVKKIDKVVTLISKERDRGSRIEIE